jgi:hypothetical protein
MRYTGLSHRLRAVEAQLGRPNQILRIIGGLPQGDQVLPPSPLADSVLSLESKPAKPSKDPGSLS